MDILVTGECGYTGCVLVPLLQAKETVDTATGLDTFSTGSPRNLLGACIRSDSNVEFQRDDVHDYSNVEHATQGVDTITPLEEVTGVSSTYDRKDERLLVDSVSDEHLRGTALRISTNYGYTPGVGFHFPISQLTYRTATDQPLTERGDGTNRRPFIHVGDAARAPKQTACNPDTWSDIMYNIGWDEEKTRVSDTAEIICKTTSIDIDITCIERMYNEKVN
ncbi:NAD-dependent epimerase/dehydratase family protein [Halocatena pleomorpha]|uniref:NAD-dependent epimerase/dehydratase family protein n=1 Tax=Halocatena pleomorpha TaxID=1785090 RepID=A0A3P3R7S3_9EURY|nr:NAD-dependent epimerase/dehydratase family protein [Halocatena pleomorpha]RRJ29486.1 NAD-dependent epimerase/dehydratase family protein [Halocatena pleomorpha]